MSARTIRVRPIDSGEPLTLLEPPVGGAEAAPGYAVIPAICDNPLCDCTVIWLDIAAIYPCDDGTFETRGPALKAQMSSDGTGLCLDDDVPAALPSTVVEWLSARLNEAPHQAWFRERWRRFRGQIGDPAYPIPEPPQDVEWLVPFCEVFPYDFDLVVADRGHHYWGSDEYCLNPTCKCDDIVVQFVDPSQPGALGYVKASLRKLNKPTVEGPMLLQRLWRALLDLYGERRLRERFQRMRDVAQHTRATTTTATAPTAAALIARPAPSRIGRNDSCPCGSGKKFKRCCRA